MGFLSPFRKRSADDPPPTESWPLFAFGKLPVYKDFISAGLTDDASREFRDWLSNGFSRHWSSRDDCRSAEIPLHAFLLRLPESRKMAVGALWGSTDQGGLRKFPFALFTILPAGKPAASVLPALDYLPVFESRAREIRRKYDAVGNLAAVYQELRGARIEVPVRKEEQIRTRLAEALARSRIGALATALFESGAPTQWAALLSGLEAAARRPTAGAAAFRFPLAEEKTPLDQLKLWTVRLTKSSPAGAVPSGVLYRTGGEAPRGVLFFRDARVEDILLFHPAAIPTDFVEEIPPPARTVAGTSAIEPAVIEPAATEPAATEPAAIEPAAIEPAATEPAAIEPAAIEPAATEPAAIEPAATEPAAIEPAAAEPAAAGVPPPLEPESPVRLIPQPEAAVPAGIPLVEGIIRLGAAAGTVEIRPASLPAGAEHEPAGATSAAPQLTARGPADAPVPATPAVAVDAPLRTPSPPAPVPQAGPAGWDLPLASLLEGA
jgi:type VI secretion system ImpM family protein